METTAQTDNNLEMNLANKFAELGKLVSTIRNDARALEKKWKKDFKTIQKEAGKGRGKGKGAKRTGNGNPSGFVKPSPISDTLATFLGKEKGIEMARTAVTKEINQYIRANNLQDKTNGRKINPDEPLKNLLQLNDTDELTYFNLQKYMTIHYPKSKAKLLSEAQATASTTI
jgi:chromatin remodeling complex protein RSC6